MWHFVSGLVGFFSDNYSEHFPAACVSLSCVRKGGRDGFKHHPCDQMKLSDISTMFRSIQENKSQLRKQERQEWAPAPQYSL